MSKSGMKPSPVTTHHEKKVEKIEIKTNPPGVGDPNRIARATVKALQELYAKNGKRKSDTNMCACGARRDPPVPETSKSIYKCWKCTFEKGV